MNDMPLGEVARALIEVTRNSHQPSAQNRARVWWGVERGLAAGSAPPFAVRRRRVLRVAALSFAALGMATAAAALSWRSAPPAVPPSESDAPPLPSLFAPEPPVREAPGAEAVVAEPSPGPRGPAAPRAVEPVPERRELAAEIEAIARAQAATNRGDGEQALALLRQAEQSRTMGVLSQEHAAARILALCVAGRSEEARGGLERFVARWPRSPQIAALRRSCAATR